jgi:hypothetical protein
MKLELKERKDGITWLSVKDKKDRHIGWISLMDFVKGKHESTYTQANKRRLDVASYIVEIFNEKQENHNE